MEIPVEILEECAQLPADYTGRVVLHVHEGLCVEADFERKWRRKVRRDRAPYLSIVRKTG